MGANFTGVIRELDLLLENEKCVLPSEALDGMKALEEDGSTSIGFMFLNQARQLSKIQELSSVFHFLDNPSSELRSLPIRLSPTPTICSVSPWTAGKGRRRRIEEAIRLILDCSENRTGV